MLILTKSEITKLGKSLQALQDWIDEHQIKSEKELKELSPQVYNYVKNIKKFLDHIVFPEIPKPEEFNTLEDFQKFIDEYDISSFHEFETRYKDLYEKLKSLKYRSLLLFGKLRKHDWEWFNTVDDFRELIEVWNITTTKECHNLNSRIYNKCKNWYSEVGLEKENKSWNYINTTENLQKFIDDHSNEIKSAVDLHDKFPGLYNRVQRNGIYKGVTYPEPKRLSPISEFIYDLETAQAYIDKMGYSCATELKKDIKNRGSSIYCRIKKLGLAKLIVYSSPRKSNWDHIKTPEDVWKFIEENDIKDRADFVERFNGVYSRCQDRGLLLNLKDHYTGEKSEFDSKWEEQIYNEILENRDLNSKIKYINHNYKLEGLVDKTNLPVDIYIEFNNGETIILEIAGATHFKPIHGNSKFFLTRKHDMLKKRWTKEKGYHMFFITFGYRDFNKYGHPYYMYLTTKELFNDLKLLLN